MNRYLCLHLHFYQPPRENPWLDQIEIQDSAYPFHDWNERISAECYRSNGASRILDADGHMVDLANNYSKISFNFGPTLLSWMEDKDPETYQRILDGDKASQKNFGGHGSAIAQAYNHIIMPLANRRDKETQVIWGIKDFERRFGRFPESMWLPETAVDTESLEVLAEHGMKYVILAPRQAKAIRKLDSDEDWKDVSGEMVNPRQPYLVKLPSGKSIAAFFYDGPISKAVAFEGLLHNGVGFAERLLSGFETSNKSTNQLLHIATDGETYGHHHRLGDMALAYAISHLERNQLATITNYGQYLELNPPKREAQIVENSSWSCEHGVERWRENCGCNSGGKSWHQRWRKPLREVTDHLRDHLEEPFEKTLRAYSDDPWAVRNAYIDVIADRSLANIERFFKKWFRQDLSDADISLILKALEAQHHLLLMFTSCAWFFDEISGIETVQNLQYAYRAIELAEAAFDVDILDSFLLELEKAESNVPDLANGREVFERYVKPAAVDNVRVGIHFAVASVFETYGKMNEIYNNKITLLDFHRSTSGKASLVSGYARVRSRVTLERHTIVFGVIHLGDHNVSAGVKTFESENEYKAFLEEAKEAFDRADFPQTMRVIDKHFGAHTYSIKDLFKDEQRRIIDLIMKEAMKATEERFRRLYDNNYPLFCYLSDLNLPIPKVFSDVAEFVENRSLRKSLSVADKVNTDQVRKYLNEARDWGTKIDEALLAHEFTSLLENKMRLFNESEEDPEKLEEILELVDLSNDLPTPISLGPVQDWFFLWYREREQHEKVEVNEKLEQTSQALAQALKVKLPDISLEGESNGFHDDTQSSSHLQTSVEKGIHV